ncbi:MAG: sterol desaturase family protein [Deltaproteobacteria bacterium]|nr:sterol desaturase family protein [Deltaproteobacteria bacterium]
MNASYLVDRLEAGALRVLSIGEMAARDAFESVFIEMPGWVVDSGSRFFWVYLLAFVVLGAVAYRIHRGAIPGTVPIDAQPSGVRGVLRYLFPRDVYTHRSAKLDYKLVLANRAFGPSVLLSRLVLGPLSVTYVATLIQEALGSLAGKSHTPSEWGPVSLVAFVIGIALVRDFSTWAVHALHHRSVLLWEFHKVHHTAEVLTPLTLYRKHPVYNFFSKVLDIAIVGPFEGVIAFLFLGEPQPMTLFGANVVFSAFHLAGSNLRHSHIWLAFGPRVSRIFMSPAGHQIHHSKAPQHWDKNFGEVFALWDWTFGTLYVAGREPEAIEFGVAGAEEEHTTLLRAYFVPFANCARIVRDSVRRLQTRYA